MKASLRYEPYRRGTLVKQLFAWLGCKIQGHPQFLALGPGDLVSHSQCVRCGHIQVHYGKPGDWRRGSSVAARAADRIQRQREDMDLAKISKARKERENVR